MSRERVLKNGAYKHGVDSMVDVLQFIQVFVNVWSDAYSRRVGRFFPIYL